jgi:type I restriction enzyme M protein
MKKISNIIKDSNYSFSLFNQELVNELEGKIIIKNGKPYIVCLIRNKEILLKPEEVARQLYLMKLIN